MFCEIYFAFANGYSGQTFFADWLPMLYNAVWTSWPCMFTYFFERDADYDFSLKNPILYIAGHKKVYFNFRVFWKYILMAYIHGLICYLFPLLGFDDQIDDSGRTFDTWFHSTLSFTLILHIVTYKLLVDSTMWNYINLTMCLISLVLYYVCVLIINMGFIA